MKLPTLNSRTAAQNRSAAHPLGAPPRIRPSCLRRHCPALVVQCSRRPSTDGTTVANEIAGGGDRRGPGGRSTFTNSAVKITGGPSGTAPYIDLPNGIVSGSDRGHHRRVDVGRYRREYVGAGYSTLGILWRRGRWRRAAAAKAGITSNSPPRAAAITTRSGSNGGTRLPAAPGPVASPPSTATSPPPLVNSFTMP